MYKDKLRKVEIASFTPLVLSCTGGVSKLSTREKNQGHG